MRPKPTQQLHSRIDLLVGVREAKKENHWSRSVECLMKAFGAECQGGALAGEDEEVDVFLRVSCGNRKGCRHGLTLYR